MISYAQNAEDVVLARLFSGKREGRYVDVGAGDPVEASVTKHFYDRGWRGINIEPIPGKAEDLRTARPDDVTLASAAGAEAGTTTLHVVQGEWGWSTVDDDLARQYRDVYDWTICDREVQVVTLCTALDTYPGDVDFLKIDVEGAERDVIDGADWDRHRPRVVIVEATVPGSSTPAHDSWEPVLLKAGYRLALFDGLNRFYAQATDPEAHARLAAPANVLDGFERFHEFQRREELKSLQASRAAEVAYVRRVENALRTAQQAHENCSQNEVELQRDVQEARATVSRTHRYATALEARISELEELIQRLKEKREL